MYVYTRPSLAHASVSLAKLKKTKTEHKTAGVKIEKDWNDFLKVVIS